jgi:hypothetical protein
VWASNPSGLPINVAYKDALYNGTITVSILNALTSNDVAYGASIICSVNCADVEYFSPLDLEYPMSMYTLQSGDDLANAPDEGTVHAEAPALVDTPTKHTIYVGEIVRSIRQLMHRTTFYSRFNTISPEQTNRSEYNSIPTISSATSYGAVSGFGGSIFLPNAPYVTGHLPVTSGPSYPNTGVMVKNGATTNADVIVNQNTKTMTPTAYFMSSYVGWRGGTVYTAKANRPWREAYGEIVSLTISRVANSISSYVTDASIWNPVIWFIKPYGGGTLPEANPYVGYQVMNQANACIRRLSKGLAGMAVTNPNKVNVVNAVVPYYSNYRMLPANPLANYYTANKPEDLPWNKLSAPSYPPGTNEVIQCPRIDYDISMFVNPVDTRYIDVHPTIDVYHKAGVDFTLFWYLNPPAIHVYTYFEGGYARDWY